MKFKNKSVAFLTFFIMGGFLSTSVESLIDKPKAELANQTKEASAYKDVSDVNRNSSSLRIRKNSQAKYVETAEDLEKKSASSEKLPLTFFQKEKPESAEVFLIEYSPSLVTTSKVNSYEGGDSENTPTTLWLW